jgi:DNA invertase Pin-like site-specific DNA recombinase
LKLFLKPLCNSAFRGLILVWKVDRFGRSLKHLVNALADLGAYGVAFVSLRDNLDLSTPSGRLMFQIIGAMAEFERALIQERVKAGLRNAEAKGKRLGRPRRFVDASRIAALRASGISWRAISREMEVGLATLYRATAT